MRQERAFIYSRRFGEFSYGAAHPFKLLRYRLTFELIEEFGLLANPATRVLEAVPADEAELLRFHHRDYLAKLREFSESATPRAADELPLSSLAQINRLAPARKKDIYRRLVPQRIFTEYGLEPADLQIGNTERACHLICPAGLGLVRIAIRPHAGERDCLFFVEVADTLFGPIELSFCLINDLAAPRFNVDVDEKGRDNCFGTVRRNRDEELRAMAAGLAPNQVRRGLGMFPEFFAQFEQFVADLGVTVIVAEPLSYDNALRYEGHGFDYLRGKQLMLWIDEEFQPGGILYRRLDGSSPFRHAGMEKTVCGRSWAIHDGILGFPWDGVKIYKNVGRHAGINTFSTRSC